MSSGSIVLKVDLTIWSNLAHNLADLLFLVFGEINLLHNQSLELSLPGEDGKQVAQALIGTAKPTMLTRDGQTLQGVELSISEGLKELGAI